MLTTRKKRTSISATLALAMAGVLTVAVSAPASADTGSTITVDLSNPGDVSKDTSDGAQERLPGWKLPNGQTKDGFVTDNEEFRLSNRSTFFSHAGYVTPALTQTAGEAGDVNTFDAEFTVGSGPAGYQEGLGVGIALEDAARSWSRYGGNVILLHQDDVLKVGTFWLDESKNTGVRPVPSANIEWSENFFAELDPTAEHEVRMVARFIDGPSNDVVDYYVNGQLVFTAPSWEGFAAIKNSAKAPVGALSFFAGANTLSVRGMPTVATIVAQPGLAANSGFHFSDISYRSYDILDVPAAPPVVEPTPSTTINEVIELLSPALADDDVPISVGGFEPYENVHFTWYSNPIFAGWAQANERGFVFTSFRVPAALGGGTHTLQGVGARSGLVASIRTFVNFTELPATGPANVALMAGGGAILLASGAALVIIKRSRNKA